MSAGSFVECRLGPTRLGVPLANVERVIRAAAVAPVPGRLGCVLGMLNLHGEPTPVYDTRRLLGMATRPLLPRDRLLLTRSGGIRQAFAVDDVLGTLECDALHEPASFSARAAGVRGIIARGDGIVFMHDLDQFLHLERAARMVVHA